MKWELWPREEPFSIRCPFLGGTGGPGAGWAAAEGLPPPARPGPCPPGPAPPPPPPRPPGGAQRLRAGRRWLLGPGPAPGAALGWAHKTGFVLVGPSVAWPSYLQGLVSRGSGTDAILCIRGGFKGYVGRCVQGENKSLFLRQAARVSQASRVAGNF